MAARSLVSGPFDADQGQPARLPDGSPPVLVVAVSTEEEFDWLASQPFDRRHTSVASARQLERGQRACDEQGVRPAYLVDHPVASQEESAAVLRGFLREGRCEIGAHLHPWVSPPFEERVEVHSSFPSNLEPGLEARKLRELARTLEDAFGQRPLSYQAGRYGFGPHTAALLAREGFQVDLSASPPFDLSREGGPDYSRVSSAPFWLDRRAGLLALPITGAFVGFLGWRPDRVHAWSQADLPRALRVPGLLARSGALQRLRLSPEGFELDDMRRLTRHLLGRGQQVFVLSYHSPSLLPGCTPYVRTERELEQFLDRLRRYLDFFLHELGGRGMTPVELRAELAGASAPAPA